MRALRLSACWVGFACSLWAQTEPDVGQGAPTELIAQRFVVAYYRNQYQLLVSVPPQGAVQRYGATGLIQYFSDAAKTSGVRYALLKGDASKPPRFDPSTQKWVEDVFQIRATMWDYYSSVGSGTAGFPVMDTQDCPLTLDNPCAYQLFDKNHALFVFEQSLGPLQGTNVSLRDPYYTAWVNAGGMRGLGAPVSSESPISSVPTGATATTVRFQQGLLVNTTSGLQNGRLFVVREPFFGFYSTPDGTMDRLGLPIGDEQALADGTRRQAFEGGTIEARPDGTVVLKLAVQSVSIHNAGTLWPMKLGESIQVRAFVTLTSGEEATDRPVAWTTSNGRVATVNSSGLTATVHAVGAGSALIAAVSEGKASTPFQVLVTAPCCAAGEGAPTLAIRQAFEDALRRNRLTVRFPAAPLRRIAAGYVQEFLTEADAPDRILVAVSDSRTVGYPLRGDILARYEALGSFTGALGYPSGDPTSAGRQDFENHAALAGNPVRLVAGALFDRWSALGKEAGAAGLPVSEAQPFLTFNATAGHAQFFKKGALYLAQSGTLNGKAFFVSGAILKSYLANAGASGRIGMPTADEVLIDGRRRQEFEGATLEAGLADIDAVVREKSRRPAISTTPAVATAGGSVRIAVGAFPEGTVLRVWVGSQPEFRVVAPAGAYSWVAFVPRDAKSETIRVRAATDDGSVQAEGSYQVRSFAETRFTLSKVQGDAQTASPGALTALRLRVAVRDPNGNPAPEVPVSWQPSPGAAIVAASATSDAGGFAEASLRMPAYEGVALATASVPGQVVTFSARALGSKLSNFTGFNIGPLNTPLGKGPAPISEGGALLASVASIIRFYQDRGDLASPNGAADLLSLNQFLLRFCVNDVQGNPLCDGFIAPEGSVEQIVNLWRVPVFAGGGAHWLAAPPNLSAIRDVVSQGAPALVMFDLAADGLPAGSHFVVANGIDAAGRVLVHDANPFFGAHAVEDLLSEFSAGGRRWKGSLTAVLQLSPQPGGSGGFLVTGARPFDLFSAGPVCGSTLAFLDRAATARTVPGLALPFYQRQCDDPSNLHQLRVTGDGAHRFFFTDLGAPAYAVPLIGSGAAVYRIERVNSWMVTPERITLNQADSILNAASLSPAIAPGTLVAIFGAGLAGPGNPTSVEVDGRAAALIAGGPFRLDAALPADLAPGRVTLKITSPFGSIENEFEIAPLAPAIFTGPGGLAAVLNENGLPNRPDQPARRGSVISIYCTGLGALRAEGSQRATEVPVTLLLEGFETAAAFSGAAPGFPGVYQVNVRLPLETAPGVGRSLVLKQGGLASPTVAIAVE